MTTTNDFAQLDYLLALAGNVEQSAEDTYLDTVEDEPAHHFPTNVERYTRTTIHHYKHATVTTVEEIVTSRRSDTLVHIYHTTTEGDSK